MSLAKSDFQYRKRNRVTEERGSNVRAELDSDGVGIGRVTQTGRSDDRDDHNCGLRG